MRHLKAPQLKDGQTGIHIEVLAGILATDLRRIVRARMTEPNDVCHAVAVVETGSGHGQGLEVQTDVAYIPPALADGVAAASGTHQG